MQNKTENNLEKFVFIGTSGNGKRYTNIGSDINEHYATTKDINPSRDSLL
jgi:hypothetical protein